MSASVENPRPASITRLPTWSELNRQWLVGAISRLRQRIETRSPDAAPGPVANTDDSSSEPATGFTPALIHCAEAFSLSPFERELLLLVAGLELDEGLRGAVSGFNSGGVARASYGLALATLVQPHWDALSPDAPLRYWHMVEIEAGSPLTQATLRLDERMLHFISGVSAADAQLDGIVNLVKPEKFDGIGDYLTLAQRVAALLADRDNRPVVVLHKEAALPASTRDLAIASLAQLARPALWISALDLPHDPASLSAIARRVDREHALTDAIPVVSVDNPAAEATALAFAGRLKSCLLWLGTPGHGLSALPSRPRVLRFELPKPDIRQSREALLARWQRVAAPDIRDDAEICAGLCQASTQFQLDAAMLEHIAARLDVTAAAASGGAIWAAAREAARGGLDALAQRIDTQVTFDDVVLPKGHRAALSDIARQLRHRERVYEDWQFGKKHQLGQGLVALFAGESGTGKTLAAEAIANEVNLDLYRVDLATLVSKYIGETEKNLKRLFDAAEASGAVLLFDEADALFGKRSEVKDSHDRYANIEVAYLLQRVEAYRGLAVLTTNMKSALDRAFLRRIRFIITFPFPDMAAREQIWRRQFPSAAPVADLDFTTLARLNLAGGNIRSVALSAAFKAADKGVPIDQDLLMTAAREEFAKLERNFSLATGGRP